jgi:large subunit ribosomal protein L4
MELVVYNFEGEETGRTASLSDSVFGIAPNEHVVYLDVKHYLANQRQGTHKSKERNEVKGSTKKIKKQKGTGGARAGSIKSPLFIGGGRIFGPKPRDYSFKLNKKTKVLARKSALSAKAKNNQIIVVESVNISKPKTKDYLKFISNFNLLDKKTLLILPENDKNVILSARNLQNCEVIEATNINTYQILKAEKLLLTLGSIEKIENLLTK